MVVLSRQYLSRTLLPLFVLFLVTNLSVGVSERRNEVRSGTLGAGEGTSFTFMIPPLPALASRFGDELSYEVEISTPLLIDSNNKTIILKKSDRPHLFVTAFCLDQSRELRKTKTSKPVTSSTSHLDTSSLLLHSSLSTVSTESSSFSNSNDISADSSIDSIPMVFNSEEGHDDEEEEDHHELVWSKTKLRNTTEGGFKFSVPLDKDVSTLHILISSNYVGSSGVIPFDINITSPLELGHRKLIELPPLHQVQYQSTKKTSPISGSPNPELSESLAPPQRILCIDGGGAKGVVPLEILSELERRSGVRTRDQFDMFCGTSTGSIIAAGISLADLPVSLLSRLYIDLTTLIFGSKLGASQRSLRLKAMMNSVFGSTRLNSFSSKSNKFSHSFEMTECDSGSGSSSSSVGEGKHAKLFSFNLKETTNSAMDEDDKVVLVSEIDEDEQGDEQSKRRQSNNRSEKSGSIHADGCVELDSQSEVKGKNEMEIEDRNACNPPLFSNHQSDRMEGSPSLNQVVCESLGKDKYFCAVATDMSTMQFRPYIFRSYKPSHDASLYDGHSCKARVVDALLASTAAPTYFTSHNFTVFGEDRTFSDGAMCANNPTHFALLEAAEIAFEEATQNKVKTSGTTSTSRASQDVKGLSVVVSLGCGQRAAAVNMAGGKGSSSTYSSWLNSFSVASNMLVGLFNLMTDSDITHEVVRRMLQCQGLKNGEAYHRLNTVLNPRHDRLNESRESELKAMQLLTREYLRKDKARDIALLVQRLKDYHPSTLKERSLLLLQEQAKLRGREEGKEVVDNGGIYYENQSEAAAASSAGWLSVPTIATWDLLSGKTSPLVERVRDWQSSRPLRKVRKTTARLTGLSGFFSKKGPMAGKRG